MPGPINRGPTVPTVVTPATTTPAQPATPTTPASTIWGANAGPAPRDNFNLTNLTGPVADSLRTAGKSDYELRPGVYPDAVGLPQVLAAAGNTPQGAAMVAGLLENFKAKTGVQVPPDVQAAAMQNPSALLKAIEVTPGQLSDGILAMNAAYKAGKLKASEPPKNLLPQKFDLKDLATLDVPNPKEPLKEVGPGLYTGDLPSELPDAQVKQNKVMAEVFERLSNNASAPDAEKFEVKLGDKSYTRVDDFLQGLKADGYQVNVSFDQRIANFAALHTVVPGSNPPAFVDVPAPLMVHTGIRDALGKEAVVPAAHSEMIISLKPGPDSHEPKLNADLKYYQGVSGTGFFPANTSVNPSWCGRTTHAQLTGDQAMKAVTLAGAFTDLVNTTAKKQNLYADGYGITGVCNDSVAVVQQAVMGKADQYPLLMKDEVLYGELKRHLSGADHRDDPTYLALRKAIRELPSDVRPNPSMKQRAAASLPWAAGQEPFVSSADARRILSE